jgi:hypothetical protein
MHYQEIWGLAGFERLGQELPPSLDRRHEQPYHRAWFR